jgi:hypothetical protein
MNQPAKFYKYISIGSVMIMLVTMGYAQTGSLTATFTPKDGKPVTLQFSQPLLKFDNTHGYWFINPHNGDRHMQFAPEAFYGDRAADVAFISFHERMNDFDFYEGGGNDSNSVTMQNKTLVISAPEYDSRALVNKPMHIHIDNFTASEISFTISGAASLRMINSSSSKGTPGSINGTAHFFREPKYTQSDVLPGCDCDPMIYATIYDEENNVRTASACEKALNNKLFDAVQKAMAPLFINVKHGGEGKMAAGDINIVMMPGHMDINVPVKDRPYCSSDYYHNGLTGFNAQKKYFSSDDRFGLRFMRAVSDEALGVTTDAAANRKIQAAKMDSLYKLVAAKKITMEQYSKAITEGLKSMSGNSSSPDIKELEAENNLYLTLIFNPDNKTETDLKLADKNKTVVTHNIKGAAFEIFSPITKDGDGNWVNSRQAIYFGKFSAPANANNGAGFDVKTTNASYPANGNKLSIYNIIIKMEGGKDLMDKAIANIDFNALQELIIKQ